MTDSGVRERPVLVVGAGPAGLATAAELTRRGITHRLVERGDSLGHSWEMLYDSLVLHTGRHMSTLPGRRYPRGTPLFPSRGDFLAYLRDYARAFALRVETGTEVRRFERRGELWTASTAGGETIDARGVVIATGIIANPRLPELPGADAFRGRVMHSVEYRRPAEFVGKRVLVVGVGNSGGEIGSELAGAGADVTVLVRSGANVVPLSIAGIPMQYLAYVVKKLPPALQSVVLRQVQRMTVRKRGAPVLPPKAGSPLDSIPIIGFHLVDHIRDGSISLRLGGVAGLTARGVRFTDGSEGEYDVVMLATGFTAALGALGGSVSTDGRGFALRRDRVTSAEHPGLWFVGHNYDSSGGLSNIRRDAPLAASAIAASAR